MTPDDFDKLQTLLATRAGYRLARDRIHLAEHSITAQASDATGCAHRLASRASTLA